jgi:hypothetical protein
VTTAPAAGTLLSFAAAVTLTFPPGGTEAGAVYTPVVLMVPQASPEDWQFSVQFTAMGLPLTVAANVCIPPASTVAVCGLTVKGAAGVAGAVIVTEADPVTEVSACEVAVTVTVAGVGTLLGAVYNPVEEMNPMAWLPPVMPFTDQVTAVFVVLAIVTVNCCVNPVVTEAAVGETVAVIEVVVELLFPPQAASPARIRNTTTPDKMTRFIYHSWLVPKNADHDCEKLEMHYLRPARFNSSAVPRVP